jgi:hypothetical protein
MAKATTATGELQELAKCRIITPYGDIKLKILPEITDSKSANYVNETIIGRSNPVITYSHSEPRMISSDLHFMVTTCQDITDNLKYMRMIESLVYPGDPSDGSPYTPPPISKFYCGRLLGDAGVCVVLKNYSVRFQGDVAWDVETYLPYRFTVTCQWEVVYACANLPTYQSIRKLDGNWPWNAPSWPCPPRSRDI